MLARCSFCRNPVCECSTNSKERGEAVYCYNCKDGLIRFHSRGSQFFFPKVSTGFARSGKLTDNKTRIWCESASRQTSTHVDSILSQKDSSFYSIHSRGAEYCPLYRILFRKNSNWILTISSTIDRRNFEISSERGWRKDKNIFKFQSDRILFFFLSRCGNKETFVTNREIQD